MKAKITLFLLAFVIAGTNILVAQNWLWAQVLSGTGGAGGQQIQVAANGNIYCFGEYQTIVPNIGTVESGNTTISGVGHNNGFIAQYDGAGNPINLINAAPTIYNGGMGFISPASADDSGNIYIGMATGGIGMVDTISVGTHSGVALSKWTADSRCLWLRYYQGSTFIPKFYRNSIYVSGNYLQPSLLFDTFHLSNPSGKEQSFLAKLDVQGNCQWIKQATGGNIIFSGYGVSNDHIYVSATTDSCFIYDTLNICTPAGQKLGILMELDTNGSIIWSKKIIATGSFYSSGMLTPLKGGGFYDLGYFQTSCYINGDTLRKTGNENIDYFLAKFDDPGSLLWAEAIPFRVQQLQGFRNMFADSLGYLYLTGAMSDTQTFGNYTVTAQTWSDMFVTRYTPGGTCLGAVTVPNSTGLAITEDSEGNAIVTGAIFGPAVFGNTTLDTTAQSSFTNQTNCFVAKLSAMNYPLSIRSLLPLDSTLQIYANPSRGLFTVEVPQSALQAGSGTLSIYDNNGSLIKTEPINMSNSHTQVDLGQVSHGVYSVLLTAQGAAYRGRVVIQ